MTADAASPNRSAGPNRQRSSIAPVGIVAATSSTAAWKKKTARTAGAAPPGPARKKPRSPATSQRCPKAWNEAIASSVAVPPSPSSGNRPWPPNIQAKPQAQNPSIDAANIPSVNAAVCAAFFARTRPTSAIAKPAFISSARQPAPTTQARLTWPRSWTRDGPSITGPVAPGMSSARARDEPRSMTSPARSASRAAQQPDDRPAPTFRPIRSRPSVDPPGPVAHRAAPVGRPPWSQSRRPDTTMRRHGSRGGIAFEKNEAD